MYRKENSLPEKVALSASGFYTAACHKFYFDEIWIFITKKIIFNCISKPIAWFDRHVVDGFMNLLSSSTNFVSRKIKVVQSGDIQDYVWVFFMGALVMVVSLIFFWWSSLPC
jgi:NADH-quinone oxidoreductase subunit L